MQQAHQAPTLSPELVKQSIALARALSAAARNWALYPPEHPAVSASVGRLGEVLKASTAGAAFAFGVTPKTLLAEMTREAREAYWGGQEQALTVRSGGVGRDSHPPRRLVSAGGGEAQDAAYCSPDLKAFLESLSSDSPPHVIDPPEPPPYAAIK